jgi:hypothetical protein
MLAYENDEMLDLCLSLATEFCEKTPRDRRRIRNISKLILVLLSNGIKTYPNGFKVQLTNGIVLYGHTYNYLVYKKVILFLQDKALINYKRGYKFEGNYSPSIVNISSSFHKTYEQLVRRAKIDEKQRRVFIRCKRGKDIFTEYSPITTTSQVFLNRYEDFLIDSKVEYNGEAFPVSPITRIFNYDQEHGGRIYGNWTFLPKKERRYLTIRGEELVEIDLTASTLNIAAKLTGHDLKDDIYNTYHSREFSKKLMIILFYSANELKARAAINALQARSKVSGENIFERCLQVIADNRMESYMMQGKGLYYVKKEADFCIDVVNTCIDSDIPVLSIHDAFLCKKSDQKSLQHIIDITYLKHFRSLPKCRTKSLSLEQKTDPP